MTTHETVYPMNIRHFTAAVCLLSLFLAPHGAVIAANGSSGTRPSASAPHLLPVGQLALTNGGYVPCRYSQNHVFDFYSGATIGYRDAENPYVVRDENGQQLGMLLTSDTIRR